MENLVYQFSRPAHRFFKPNLAAAAKISRYCLYLYLCLHLFQNQGNPSQHQKRRFIIDHLVMKTHDPIPQNLTAGYHTAVSRFDLISKQEAGIVHEAGQSLLMAHGARTPRAYVLLHGTTNSPANWLEFGRLLFDLGHNVFVPRAPYHGLRSRQARELAQLTPDDLRAHAHEVVDIGLGLGDELFLIGVSGGATIAAWAAQNRPEIRCALLGMPFFGLFVLPDGLSFQLMELLRRLPDFTLTKPTEPHRPWVYRGQSSHGAAAYYFLGCEVLDQARAGAAPAGEVIILTTAKDRLANNRTTAGLAEMWRRSGVVVVPYDFRRVLDVPHNSADPAADPIKRKLFYEKMLQLLGEKSDSLQALENQKWNGRF
jgi:carboxylesterase